MKIKDEIFCHFQRKNTDTTDWNIGNKFNWNSRPNNFNKAINEMDLRIPLNGQRQSYRKAFKETFNGRISVDNPELINFFNFTNFALNKTSMMLRELILENYRKEYFPDLPSRFNCIWVCKEENLDYWSKSLQIEQFDILRLRLNGNLHISTDRSLYSDVMNVKEYQQLAEKYWEQNQSWTNDSEAIFDGIIEVISRNETGYNNE